MSVQGLAALGLIFVIAVRQYELSFPGVVWLGAMTLGWLIAAGEQLSVAVAGNVGVAFGLADGVAVARLRLPDIRRTIATGGVAVGLTYIYSNGTSVSENFVMSGILDLNDRKVLWLDQPFALLLAVAVAAFVLLHATPFGHAFYATGENRVPARVSGFPVEG